MQLSVNTDDFIYGDEHVIDVSENAVRTGLAFLADRLTRVEVHLKDQNADKHGPEHIRCTMEVRPRGMDPIAANSDAADIQAALKGAAKTLRGRLSSSFEKLDPHR